MCRFAQNKTPLIPFLPHCAKQHMVTYPVGLVGEMTCLRSRKLMNQNDVNDLSKFQTYSLQSIHTKEWFLSQWPQSVLETTPPPPVSRTRMCEREQRWCVWDRPHSSRRVGLGRRWCVWHRMDFKSQRFSSENVTLSEKKRNEINNVF